MGAIFLGLNKIADTQENSDNGTGCVCGASGELTNTIYELITASLSAERGNSYEYGELRSLNLSATVPTNLKVVNRFTVKFISGVIPTEVILPPNIIKDAGFTIAANMYVTLDFEYVWAKWVLFDRSIVKP